MNAGSVLRLLGGLCLLATSAGVFAQGVQPEPFRADVNQLYALVLGTDSIGRQFDDVLLAHPPDPTNPCAAGNDCNGPVNRVTTMAKKLDRINDFVNFTMNDIIDAVIVVPPPDDNMPVLDVLGTVRDSADVIVASANAYLGAPPDDGIPIEFLGAVASVKNSADTLSNTADGFIRRILGEVPTDG